MPQDTDYKNQVFDLARDIVYQRLEKAEKTSTRWQTSQVCHICRKSTKGKRKTKMANKLNVKSDQFQIRSKIVKKWQSVTV
jgi:hypothetical protein